MSAKSKTAKVAEVANVETTAEVAKEEPKFLTIALPKGSKVTASKRTIIAPAHAITAGKERWFEVKRLKGYKVVDGIITIEINESALGYRQMLPDAS